MRRLSTLLPLLLAFGCDGARHVGAAPIHALYGLDERPANPTCVAPPRPPPSTPAQFVRVFANVQLANAVVLAQPPGDPTRWFVAERMAPDGVNARIVSFDARQPADQPALVATLGPVAYVTQVDGEGGLIGMAFHPRFGENGRLYVSWVRADAAAQYGVRSAVGWLTSSDGGAHFSDYRELFSFEQTWSHYHKGGGLLFGPDGFLYASFGDGGTGDDTFHHGQSTDGFFAKIHRIDVDHGDDGRAYAIPDGNPFKHGGGQDTTFAYGFRNPFRFSIDRATGRLWAADVGGENWEEIDLVDAGGNYGWPCREAAHDNILPPDPRCPSLNGLRDPVFEQAHAGEPRAIIGGVVYRGKAIPSLVGSYIFGDFARRELYAMKVDPSPEAASLTLLNPSGEPEGGWTDFAEDADGEIYALAMEGAIYKLVPTTPAPSTMPVRLSATGCVDAANPAAPAAGLIPYDVNAPLWSDGADKERWMAIPDGATIAVEDDGHFTLPVGSVLVKTFSLGGKPVETRLLVHHDGAGWAGYSYAWLDDGSDAVLLDGSRTSFVGDQRWYFPSSEQCRLCHNGAAGGPLGLELGQLDRTLRYPSTDRVADQLATLDHVGLFAAPLGDAPRSPYPDPAGDAPLAIRARAYLHANCAYCHRPDGPGIVDMDLRFWTGLGDMHACNVPPTEGDLGVAGAMRITPGAPERSLVSLRPHATVEGRMPPLATSIVDDAGLGVVDEWIASLAHCP